MSESESAEQSCSLVTCVFTLTKVPIIRVMVSGSRWARLNRINEILTQLERPNCSIQANVRVD